MELLYTRNWYITVRWPGRRGDLRVESNFADTQCERSALLEIAPETLRIRRASWEEHRSQNGRPDPEHHAVEGLVGVEAFFHCGKEIQAALPDDPEGTTADLFKEAVKVVIQAEALFLRERGFAGVESYAEHLIPKYVYGGCFFGSHPERTPYIVRDKFAFQHRKENLFTRYRSMSVYREPGRYRVIGTINDSYHEMQIALAARAGDFSITEASAELIRGPERVCPGATAVFDRLPGLYLTPEGRKDCLRTTGSGDGCAHLADLVGEAVKAVHSPWAQGRPGEPWPQRGGRVGQLPV